MKKSAKSKAVKPLLEAVDRITGSQVTMSMGSVVIDCANGDLSFGTPILVPVYDTKGNIVAVSQVPEILSPLPILVEIPLRGRDQAGVQWRG